MWALAWCIFGIDAVHHVLTQVSSCGRNSPAEQHIGSTLLADTQVLLRMGPYILR